LCGWKPAWAQEACSLLSQSLQSASRVSAVWTRPKWSLQGCSAEPWHFLSLALPPIKPEALGGEIKQLNQITLNRNVKKSVIDMSQPPVE